MGPSIALLSAGEIETPHKIGGAPRGSLGHLDGDETLFEQADEIVFKDVHLIFIHPVLNVLEQIRGCCVWVANAFLYRIVVDENLCGEYTARLVLSR